MHDRLHEIVSIQTFTKDSTSLTQSPLKGLVALQREVTDETVQEESIAKIAATSAAAEPATDQPAAAPSTSDTMIVRVGKHYDDCVSIDELASMSKQHHHD